MRIAIDIDSTLHHYWDQFSSVVLRRYGVELPYERQRTWAISLLEPEQVREAVMETHLAEHVSAAVPYPGAVATINRWHEQGHFIHITSHRAGESHAYTAEWLEAIGLRHHELYCSYDKIARCREIEIDLLIDDSPVNIERALDAGILAATIVHPWNRALVEAGAVVGGEDWHSLATALEETLRGGS